MTLIFLMSLMLSDQVQANTLEPVIYGGTSIFEPVVKAEVVVTKQGHVYILDFHARRILHYDAKGQLLGSFGGRGQGPGEFEFPQNLMADDAHIYVQDMSHDLVNVFDHQGKFIEAMRTPGHVNLARVKGGWVYCNASSANPNAPLSVTYADYYLKETREILQLKRSSEKGLRVEMGPGQSRPIARFNPVSDGPSIAATPDGLWVYAREANSNKILVIDAVKGALHGSFEIDEPTIPFDLEYGQAQVDDVAATLKAKHSPVKVVADFPDAFPLVREMGVDHLGNLLIRTWTGKPDEVERYLRFDRQGKELDLPHQDKSLLRLITTVGNDAYVNAYNEDDDAYLLRVPLNQVDATVAAHSNEGERKPRMLRRNG